MNLRNAASASIKQTSHAEEVIFSDGDTDDIVSVILHADKLAGPFTERFAPYLRGRTEAETTEKVWHFVKNEIRYQKDRNGHERIKSPGKLWADKEGDCKSMSVFVASILRNLGVPYKYRFAHYPNPSRPLDKDVNHVFVVAVDRHGREIPVDTVASRWNYEEPYDYAYDEDITTAPASRQAISGIFNIDVKQYLAPLGLAFFLGFLTAKVTE